MAASILLHELDQLAGLLGTLARRVARGRCPSDDDVRTLLAEAGVTPSPALVREVSRWTGLLQRAHEDRSAATAAATVKALTRQGLPEASAVLAVAMVTAATEHLRAQVDLGQADTPGDAWRAEPRGPRWGGAAAAAATFVVATDGSGTHRGLAEALDAAPPGAVVRLARGIHYLKRGLLLRRPVTLVGDGMDATELVGHQGQFVLAFQRAGLLQLRDLTIRWAGAAGHASVLAMTDGEIDAERCRFCGAAGSAPNGGAGLLLAGQVIGRVRECQMEANRAGIAVHGEATPYLEENTCSGNSGPGISYLGRAGGTARGNRCASNGSDGISVEERAGPLLEGNTCEYNGWSGIGCAGSSEPAVRANACVHNQHSGIHVRADGQPVVEGNTCADNADSGISYAANGAGAAMENRCLRNGKYGICITQRGAPFLATNELRQNRDSGIAYFGRGAGTARSNTSSQNGHHGIAIGDQAHPLLEGNVCERNRWSGIAYFESAAGAAVRNRCSRNGKRDLVVGPDATPALTENQCDPPWALAQLLHLRPAPRGPHARKTGPATQSR